MLDRLNSISKKPSALNVALCEKRVLEANAHCDVLSQFKLRNSTAYRVNPVKKVPFNNLKKHHLAHRESFHRILDELLDSCAYVGGPAVSQFEADFAKFSGNAHCAAVGNGTEAIFAALKAKGIGSGDLVVTVPNTFIATTEAISMTGAEIVFVDIDPKDNNMSVKGLAEVLDCHPEKDRIRAVLPVHLYGQPADLKAIRTLTENRNICIIADSAQAHGAKIDSTPIGLLADLSTYSFYPGKNLGALGDGGAITGEKKEDMEFIRSYCNHGRQGKYTHHAEGSNSRLDSLQAAFLSRKLEVLESKTLSRQALGKAFSGLLSDIDEIEAPFHLDSRPSVYHLYVIKVDDRERVAAKLLEMGVQTGIHYPVPLHLQEAYAHLNLKKGAFPETEKAATRILTLPLYPEMEEWEVPYVVECLKKCL